MILDRLAPAKVNLFLHVGPAKANGRHALDSLVVFAGPEASDRLTAGPGDALTLDVTGPGAGEAGRGQDNLVLRAARALREAAGPGPGARLTLDKRLPVAAGIGGGSADAAAGLRLLTALWGLDPGLAARLAPSLGGDVPVALAGMPALMRGEGERVRPVSLPGPLPALLVNPGRPCPTGAVFAAYDADDGGQGFAEIPAVPDFHSIEALALWLHEQRNDLAAPAIRLVPEIGLALESLRAQPGVHLARMSGSGATCFALFDTLAAASQASAAIARDRPDWWRAVCHLGAAP